MNEYLVNYLQTENITRIEELDDKLNEILEKSKIETDSNEIGKNLNINHIDFSPRIYCDTTNSNINSIKLRYLQKTIIPELDLREGPHNVTLPLFFQKMFHA